MTYRATIVVPTYRRPEALTRLLESLRQQSLPNDAFEVVVVDDGSLPTELERITTAARDCPFDLRVVSPGHRGPAGARNAGARLARSPLLLFTDDDCVPLPRWAEAMVDAHGRSGDALYGGATYNAITDDLWAEASQLLSDHLCGTPALERGMLRYFPSNNIAVPTDLFLAMDGFDERFPGAAGEDRDLGERMARAGVPLIRVCDAWVAHHHRLGARGFIRQHLNYGRGGWHVAGAHRQHLAPVLLLRALVSPLHQPRVQRRLTAALVVSQLANAVGMAQGAMGAR